MYSLLRSRTFSSSQCKTLGFQILNRTFSGAGAGASAGDEGARRRVELLKLDEVETILRDVRADNVSVIPVPKNCDFADFMVVATGRSAWHVRNIAQAIIYKVKQKQQGSKRMLLPSVEGLKGGNWVVIDSGTLVIHALDEKVRSYYNLEALWNTDLSNEDHAQDLDKAFVKVRPKNNSKKRPVSA